MAYVRNPADILNYGGIKCYPVYWVRTRGRVVAGSKYYLNKNKNKNYSGPAAGKIGGIKLEARWTLEAKAGIKCFRCLLS